VFRLLLPYDRKVVLRLRGPVGRDRTTRSTALALREFKGL
jgi:hypothetical protein